MANFFMKYWHFSLAPYEVMPYNGECRGAISPLAPYTFDAKRQKYIRVN